MKAFSGKFVLRIAPRLHILLRRQAQEKNISLNTLCSEVLSSSLKGSAPISSPFLPPHFFNSLIKHWEERIHAIVLFGSTVRKEETEHSDIDLLFVLKEGQEMNRELYREWDLFYLPFQKSLSHMKEISPQFVQTPKNLLEVGSLWYEIAMEGIVLWHSDDMIFHILQHLRETIADGKIKRMFSHGHPYWIKS